MTTTRNPFVVQALAGLLTFYAMAGAWLAMTMATNRDSRFYWLPLAIGGIIFAASSGFAAQAVWRRDPRGPLLLVVGAVIGGMLCSAMPLGVRGAAIDRDTWLAAITGGVLFAAFLILAARYVRIYLRSIG